MYYIITILTIALSCSCLNNVVLNSDTINYNKRRTKYKFDPHESIKNYPDMLHKTHIDTKRDISHFIVTVFYKDLCNENIVFVADLRNLIYKYYLGIAKKEFSGLYECSKSFLTLKNYFIWTNSKWKIDPIYLEEFCDKFNKFGTINLFLKLLNSGYVNDLDEVFPYIISPKITEYILTCNKNEILSKINFSAVLAFYLTKAIYTTNLKYRHTGDRLKKAIDICLKIAYYLDKSRNVENFFTYDKQLKELVKEFYCLKIG